MVKIHYTQSMTLEGGPDSGPVCFFVNALLRRCCCLLFLLSPSPPLVHGQCAATDMKKCVVIFLAALGVFWHAGTVGT